MNRTILALPLAFVLACAPEAPAIDAAPAADAGRRDAALLDAPASDAFVPSDSGVADAPTRDAALDAFALDATHDAAPSDVTTLRIRYPAGHALTVRGSAAPLDWTTGSPVPEIGGGVYEIAIHGLAAPIELKPLLDGVTWSRGPNYHLAPGQTIEIAPHFVSTSGRFVTLLPAWSSTLLGNTRAVYAYLPPAYDENTAAHFTVLYMHDGQNLWAAHPELAFGATWQVDTAMNSAGENGRCPSGSTCANDGDCGGARCDTFDDTIVIGVANTSARICEYTPTTDPGTPGGGCGDTYLHALASELAPMVDAMLRTRMGPADTAMMGSSLGGLITAHAGIVRPETFGRVGAMSPSTWWNGTEIITEVGTIASRTTRALRVYVDSGDSGASMDDVTNTSHLAMAYRTAGYVEGADFHYVVQPGGQHDETYWAQRLPAALAFLLPARERPAH